MSTDSKAPELDEGSEAVGDHLDALRSSLIWAISLPILLMATIWPFALDHVSPLFSDPLLTEAQRKMLTRLDVFDSFSVSVSISIQAAIFISMPWVIWHLWRFISPGLYDHEKRFARVAVPGAILLYLVGVAFAYFVVLPFSLDFLLNFGSETIGSQQLSIRSFFSFVFSMLMVNGITFQIPLIVAPLIRFGVLHPDTIRKRRRMLIFLSAFLGAILTPTADPVTMTVVATPIYLLVEGGMWLGIIWKKRADKIAAREPKSVAEGWREGLGEALQSGGEGLLGEKGAESFAKSISKLAREFSDNVREGGDEFQRLADQHDDEAKKAEDSPALPEPSTSSADAESDGESDAASDPDQDAGDDDQTPPAAPDSDADPSPTPPTQPSAPAAATPLLDDAGDAVDSVEPQAEAPAAPAARNENLASGHVNLAPHSPVVAHEGPLAPTPARELSEAERATRPVPQLPRELRRRIDAYVRDRMRELLEEILAEMRDEPAPEAHTGVEQPSNDAPEPNDAPAQEPEDDGRTDEQG